jgi:hypothetical protein
MIPLRIGAQVVAEEPPSSQRGLTVKFGEVHCRDDSANDRQASNIGTMRRLVAKEHASCACRGTWRGDGFALIDGNKLLEHLICTRCGYRWVSDPRAVRPGFAVSG